MKKKLYIIGGNQYINYANWILPLGFETTKDIREADLVLGAGGEDWNPSYYNDSVGRYTSFNPDRDEYEWNVFAYCVAEKKPFVGICRSAQGGCIFSGGKLIQHMSHPGVHEINTYLGDKVFVSSSHHQNQFPFNLPEDEYKILGWANNISPVHWNGNNEEMNPPNEPDIVLYKKTNFLCIQNHPEYLYPHKDHDYRFAESTKFHQALLKEYLENKL